VTVLVVSHDGSRWLETVLDAVATQTRRPDGVLAVDTGSTDGSVDLLHRRLGNDGFVTAPAHVSYGAAVARGLEVLPPPAPGEDAWIWLLHDDSAPAPDALERLLATAADQPGVDVLGPKLREWPSLRRLLEVGVTISGTGRRETGLERGEYDQGQHDRQRDVLAVNTAGMLAPAPVQDSARHDDERDPARDQARLGRVAHLERPGLQRARDDDDDDREDREPVPSRERGGEQRARVAPRCVPEERRRDGAAQYEAAAHDDRERQVVQELEQIDVEGLHLRSNVAAGRTPRNFRATRSV
jgi:glycosyltransferase involved in cell wall biosynthesis